MAANETTENENDVGTEREEENDVDTGGTVSRKSLHDPQVVEEWTREQLELKKKLIIEDSVDWFEPSNQNPYNGLHYLGGVDISFPKGDDDHACASLVVLSFPDLEVISEYSDFVHLTQPYIPEFLAFREVPFLVDCMNKMKQKSPECTPQVILVDGNGVLHPRGFGFACHFGVSVDIPTVGVAKKLFHVDGLEKDPSHSKKIDDLLHEGGDTFPLTGNSGKTLGMALRSTENSSNPVYVSIGHKLSLKSAVQLVKHCCKFRVPEPIRQADICSRKYLREHYTEKVKNCWCRKQIEDQTSSTGQKIQTQMNESLSNLHIE